MVAVRKLWWYRNCGGTEIVIMERKIIWHNNQEYQSFEVRSFIATIERYTNTIAPLTPDMFDEIRKKISPDWSDEQIVATWHHLAIHRSGKTVKNISKVSHEELASATGDNLDKLATKYDISPLVLVKQILIARGFREKLAKSYIEEPNLIEDEQTYLLVLRGWETDAENPNTLKILFEKAREYEIIVEEALHKIGIKFKTQERLVFEQNQLYGRPVLTPDFLFPEPLPIEVYHPDGSITEYKIKWIDVKNYMFLGARSINLQLKDQAAKYTKEFGKGAFMFHYGMIGGVKVGDTVILSTSLADLLKDNVLDEQRENKQDDEVVKETI